MRVNGLFLLVKSKTYHTRTSDNQHICLSNLCLAPPPKSLTFKKNKIKTNMKLTRSKLVEWNPWQSSEKNPGWQSLCSPLQSVLINQTLLPLLLQVGCSFCWADVWLHVPPCWKHNWEYFVSLTLGWVSIGRGSLSDHRPISQWRRGLRPRGVEQAPRSR